MTGNILLNSPAKINLTLRVLRKRADGYHDILSVMAPVALYDRITLSALGGDAITVSSDDRAVPSDKTNLAYRAAELFLGRAGIKSRVEIHIEKVIPVAAGLGGGSSNAATVLMGLNGLLGGVFGDDALMDMASLLGSDVPFFILKGAALAESRGTELKRFNLPPYYYVLVNPGFQVSTAWVYNNLDLTKCLGDNMLIYSEEAFALPDKIAKRLVNDLETVTLERFPRIAVIKEALLRLGALGSLQSGSGPTVFGLFVDRGKAEEAFKALKAGICGDCRVFLADGI